MERVDLRERFLQGNAWLSAARVTRVRFAHKAFFRHEGYEVLAVLGGACSEQVNNRRYSLKKGDLLFLAEGEYHAMTVPDRCEIAFINCRPDRIFSHPDLLARFLRPFRSGASGGSHKVAKRPALFSETLKLAERAGKGTLDTFTAAKAVMRWMDLFPETGNGASRRTERFRQALRPALDLIFGSYDKPLTADSLVLACAMSRMSFYRRFKAAYGRHPKRFLNDVRMGRAYDLIATTDRKISAVALCVGFENLSNFNRVFKRHFRISPGGIRRAGENQFQSRSPA